MTDLYPIYEAFESGFTGSWQWTIFISKNDDGSYQLFIDQSIWDSNDDAEPVSYKLVSFRTGIKLFDFLQSTWYGAHWEELDIGAWQEIISNIGKLDSDLAAQVMQALQINGDDILPIKTAEVLAIEHCAKSARWDKLLYSGGGEMWATISESRKMQDAVLRYVTNYYQQRKKLPEGEHKIIDITVTF